VVVDLEAVVLVMVVVEALVLFLQRQLLFLKLNQFLPHRAPIYLSVKMIYVAEKMRLKNKSILNAKMICVVERTRLKKKNILNAKMICVRIAISKQFRPTMVKL